MAGSIFVHALASDRLSRLAEDLAYLSEFPHLELADLQTLDFAQIEGADGWAEGAPVLVADASGLAIFKVGEAALRAVLHVGLGPDSSTAQLHDLRALRAFVALHGAQHLYELATC
jgi:hypothetical protein